MPPYEPLALLREELLRSFLFSLAVNPNGR